MSLPGSNRAPPLRGGSTIEKNVCIRRSIAYHFSVPALLAPERSLLLELERAPVPLADLRGTPRDFTFVALCLRKLARRGYENGTFVATLTVAGFDAADEILRDSP